MHSCGCLLSMIAYCRHCLDSCCLQSSIKHAAAAVLLLLRRRAERRLCSAGAVFFALQRPCDNPSARVYASP